MSDGERMRLYALGLTDLAISRAVGVDRTTIRYWRKKRGLSAMNDSACMPVAPVREGQRHRLYLNGLSDGEIASAEGIAADAIRNWRKRRGLAAHVARQYLTPERRRARLDKYHQGMSDGGIAKAENVSPGTIHNWRLRNGLAPHTAPLFHTPEQRAARMFLYALGYSDLKIAREQHVSASVVVKWRKRLSLCSNKLARGDRRKDKAREILSRIRRAVGHRLSADLADDAVADLYLAVVSGALPIARIEAEARTFGNQVLGQFANKFGPRSLDEDIGDDNGFRMLDLIRDERSSGWLEEMGATVW